MKEDYPEDYNGPKAGKSTRKEYLQVRDYQAFKYVRDGIWSYADFDNYLYGMCEDHYEKGEKRAIEALQAFQEICNIKDLRKSS